MVRNRLAHSWLCLLLLFVLADAASFAASDRSAVPEEAAARELFRLTNQDRAKQGKAPLEWEDRLAKVATEHAYLMAEHKQLSHQFSGEPSLRLRIAKTSLRLDHSGENVAEDTSGVEGIHIGLMNSPPHRANILNADYNAIGIAVVKRGDYYFAVEDFANRLPEIEAAQVEEQISVGFERARRHAGYPPVHRIARTGLREYACGMAGNDEVNARQVDIPLARYILAFTISEPEKLPADLAKLTSNQEIGSFAIGSCFGRTPSYPSGVFWNVMAFFPKSEKPQRAQ